jgi:hypothetical protein
MKNILDYINELIEQGYSEEDAERCADCLYSEHWESDDDLPDFNSPEAFFCEPD